jgi:hypothetical protein
MIIIYPFPGGSANKNPITVRTNQTLRAISGFRLLIVKNRKAKNKKGNVKPKRGSRNPKRKSSIHSVRNENLNINSCRTRRIYAEFIHAHNA